MTLTITSTHQKQYDQDGYTMVKSGFSTDECDHFIDYMMDLHTGRIKIEGYPPRQPDDWSRLISRSLHHPQGLAWMLDPRLRQALRTFLGDEPDGVQSMYFYKSSEQRRHQDAFYLPGCMSAWVALQDVGAYNGTVHLQVGSHHTTLIEKKDFKQAADGTPGAWYGWNQDDAFDALFTRNAMPEIAIEAAKGDIVFFNGRLIHRGGPIEDSSAFRHSWAGHYIPHSYNPWPYADNPRLRVSFDGVCRFTPTH